MYLANLVPSVYTTYLPNYASAKKSINKHLL